MNKNYLVNYIKQRYKPLDFKISNWTNVFNKANSESLLRFIQNPSEEAETRRLYRIIFGRNAPIEANLNDITRKLPKKIHRKQNVNTSLPKKGENFKGRKQLGGTCWFNAILNAWMLSDLGRIVMKRQLRAFESSHEMKPYETIKACPMRKKLPAAYFWSYVKHMLKPKNPKFHSNVMRGIEFPEGKLIRSSHLRANKENVSGGNLYIDSENFSEVLFEDPGIRNAIIYGKLIKNPKESIPEKIGNYVLSHAIISGEISKNNNKKSFGHGIAGYKSRGRYMIFDSNKTQPQFLDWRKSPKLLELYFDMEYDYEDANINIYLIYLNRKMITLLNSRPEVQFNRNTYNNRRSIHRYPRQSILKFFRQFYNASNFTNSNKNNLKKAFNSHSNLSNKNLNKIKQYIELKNNPANGNFRVKLRRMYRLKYGKPAPSHFTNKQIILSLNKNKLYILKFLR